jgi:hypothetical protein
MGEVYWGCFEGRCCPAVSAEAVAAPSAVRVPEAWLGRGRLRRRIGL